MYMDIQSEYYSGSMTKRGVSDVLPAFEVGLETDKTFPSLAIGVAKSKTSYSHHLVSPRIKRRAPQLKLAPASRKNGILSSG